MTVSTTELDLLVSGEHGDPHTILGPHVENDVVTVRVLRPLAESVTVVAGGARTPLRHEHAGVWAGELGTAEVPDYRVEVVYDGHEPVTHDDPYRYLPTLGDTDLHLVNEGRHERLWTSSAHTSARSPAESPAPPSRSGRPTRAACG